MIELLLRLVASLAVVVGLLLLLAKLGSRRFSGSSDGLVRVVHRQPLSRTSSLAVIDVAGRVLVLGTTEQQISLITELDSMDLELAEGRADIPTSRRGGHDETYAPDEHLDSLDHAAYASLASTRARATQVTRGTQGSAPIGSTAISGSVLSPATWQAARQALGGRPAGGRRRAGGARRAS